MLKSYVTNIPLTLMPAGEVKGSYHDLWHVEQSFRMSETDLQTRQIHHYTEKAINAHLTVIFAALAVARYMQDRTGLSLEKIIHTLGPIRSGVLEVRGHTQLVPAKIPPEAAEIIGQITQKPGY